ncbi:hypothetical protein [Nostoc sp. NMS1]|uniref:hypothetical protein n=1 Tax=Nostoc sp. NMS1 TaxID=2815388 RepID=UPI0025F4540A|nr:hypothetical protein [Nostoc sp. NMS1]
MIVAYTIFDFRYWIGNRLLFLGYVNLCAALFFQIGIRRMSEIKVGKMYYNKMSSVNTYKKIAHPKGWLFVEFETRHVTAIHSPCKTFHHHLLVAAYQPLLATST